MMHTRDYKVKQKEACKVSVIIPVFNTEQWIHECLDSVITQTLQDIEIICINDGSTDKSADIIAEYANKDGRLVLINQENGGVSSARNTGLNAASGKYLFFLDSDDTLVSDALEVLFYRMEERRLEVISFNARAFSDIDELEKKTQHENNIYYERELDESVECTGIEFLAYIAEESTYNATVYNLMLLRSFVEKNHIRFISGIIHEDEAFVFEAYIKANRAGCINQYLYNRRYRQGSIMTVNFRFVNVYGVYRVCKRIEQLIKEVDIPEQYVSVALSHLSRLEKSAVGKYLTCSAEEKDKVHDLPIAERAELEQFLMYPVSLQTSIRKLKKENSKLKKENSKLKNTIAEKENFIITIVRKVIKRIKQV